MRSIRGSTRRRAAGFGAHGRPLRRGSAANALVVTISALVTAGLSFVIIHPRFTDAGDTRGGAPDVTASDPVHQEVIEQIARLIGRSRAVLFHHEPDPSPYREVLLWVSDEQNPGRIDPEEIVLLSFSPTLQAIAAYVWEPESRARKPEDGRHDSAIAHRSSAAGFQLPADVGSSAFCDQWRTQPGVVRHTIATQIQDAAWDAPESYRPSDGLWRITLTWVSKSADQSDGASITVRRGRIGAR